MFIKKKKKKKEKKKNRNNRIFGPEAQGELGVVVEEEEDYPRGVLCKYSSLIHSESLDYIQTEDGCSKAETHSLS